jgi:hypothetical protein
VGCVAHASSEAGSEDPDPLSIEEEFRVRLAAVLKHSWLSRSGLNAAMGRDSGYVAALLDPTRPSRARTTPDDLVRASDALGFPLVELLEALWGIDRATLAAELHRRRRGRIQ